MLIKIVIRNDNDNSIVQEISREKNIDCDPAELKAEVHKKKVFLENKFLNIWSHGDPESMDVSIDVVVTQIIPL